MHEHEEQRLKQHYEQHRELYIGVTSWQNNWTLFQELEVRARGTVFYWRLFGRVPVPTPLTVDL